MDKDSSKNGEKKGLSPYNAGHVIIIFWGKRVLPEASLLEECHPDILPDNLPDFLSRKFAQNYAPSLYIVLNLPETRFHCSREAKITNFLSPKDVKIVS